MILSIIQSIYIIFILNFFKTTYSLAHPITYFSNSLLYHPIGISKEPRSMICKLGHKMSYYLALFILLRGLLLSHTKKYSKLLKYSSLLILIFTVTLSMLNLNAVIYLLPHFYIEIMNINYNFFYI